MATLVTEICNMALGRIGANRLAYTGTTETDLDANTTLEAIQCNLNYEQTRNSLLRSHWWNFASARANLVLDTETPPFEWSYQFKLPDDYLRMRTVYDSILYTIEGNKFLTNDSEVSIRYIRKVTDVSEFDTLFVEVLVLRLALKLLPALAGTQTPQFRQELKQDLMIEIGKAVTIDSQETNDTGSSDWNNARFGSGKV